MKNEKIIKQFLETIEVINQHIQAVHAARYFVTCNGLRDVPVHEDITDKLYQLELSAW